MYIVSCVCVCRHHARSQTLVSTLLFFWELTFEGFEATSSQVLNRVWGFQWIRLRDSLRSIAALDQTGDGRLQFFEFLGAMIGAGRIQRPDTG